MENSLIVHVLHITQVLVISRRRSCWAWRRLRHFKIPVWQTCTESYFCQTCCHLVCLYMCHCCQDCLLHVQRSERHIRRLELCFQVLVRWWKSSGNFSQVSRAAYCFIVYLRTIKFSTLWKLRSHWFRTKNSWRTFHAPVWWMLPMPLGNVRFRS